MTENYQFFQRDPRTFKIPNDGVARVFTPSTTQEWDALRYELEAFVCEGEYREGLERILRSYLANLQSAVQPAVWVSGFYGSGKSHLVRVLEYLWRDIEFPDGARARGLVKLPSELQALLQELSTVGRRQGGLWSAAGTLSAGSGSVRLALLAIFFQAAGLPTLYNQAQFVIWLQKRKIYAAIKAAVEAEGVAFGKELNDLYVSPLIANAILAADPSFATSASEARKFLLAQFPKLDEISNEQFLDTVDTVLRMQADNPDKLPCALLVLDELQVFLGDSGERILHVQNIVEACSARLGSRLLFVGTGQDALEATTQLSKLRDRFTVRVALEDRDVVRVVREVILRKQPSREAELGAVLERASGEIDRHLPGTKVAPTAADKNTLIDDYPLLPTRRRLWEAILRAIDSAGTSGQLRNQLRLTHTAVREVAQKPAGHVIPVDFIYWQQEQVMLQGRILLQEVANTIQTLRDGSAEGELSAKICATIFLINQLPTKGIAPTGLSATADTLADLLVIDLPAGSSNLRQRIPQLLQALVNKGIVMDVEGEYRLQTREGQEWEREYRARLAKIRADESRIADERTSLLQKAVANALRDIKPVQGKSKTPRKVELLFGQDAPNATANAVPVWVRDEWSVSAKTLREEAQAVGVESPIVSVLLPRQEADSLRETIAAHSAASETLLARQQANTEEGITARQAMETRQKSEAMKLQALVSAILNKASVYQGGGTEVVADTLSAAVSLAVEAALVRLFPNFAEADHAGWGNVVKRAGQGAADALGAVEYQGNVEQHPVCKQVRQYVGAQRKGGEVRTYFRGAGYGWPDDAIDGALMTLMAAGLINARKNSQPVGVKELAQSQIGVTEFYGEEAIITTVQRIQLRAWLSEVGVKVESGDEGKGVTQALQMLLDLAEEAGGAAPLPALPDTSLIKKLQSRNGNAQLLETFAAREELKSHDQAWKQAKTLKAERSPRWDRLQRLLTHADGIVAGKAARPQAEAIFANRSLLNDLDPLKPLLDELVNGLRTTLQGERERYAKVREQQVQALAETDEWTNLPDERWQAILQRNQVGPTPPIAVATEDELLKTLDDRPLSLWRTLTEAIPSRIQAARLEAIRILKPEAVPVKPRSTTLASADEVDDYLAELRQEIMQHVAQGVPVII